MNIGIIAEDASDVAVLREMTLKLLRPHRVGFKKFVGNGCGKLRRKCGAWARNLVLQGCPWILVAHDLDDYNERTLRAELSAAVGAAGADSSVVLIPHREIEAWLLYDSRAIAKAFGENRLLRVPGDPESLADPKRHLGELVRRKYQKDYVNTLHNHVIARYVDLSELRRSRSFAPHPIFVRTVRRMLA